MNLSRIANLVMSMMLMVAAASGCGSDPDLGGACTDFTGFTTPVVPVDAVTRVIPLGELNPPEDVVPAVSGGFGFNQASVNIVAPGPVVITSVESTEYLVSPGRQGVTDFGLVMHACDDIKIQFAHIVTLDASLAAKLGSKSCETFAGAEETTEDCRYSVNIKLEEGDPIGVTGTYQNNTPTGLDFSAVDLSYDIPWLNPDRVGDLENYHHGICSYTLFEPTIANAYLDKATSGLVPLTRDERCGLAAIGVANTPQGMWVREDNQVTLQQDIGQDAPNFLTLSPGVADPDVALLISSGVADLGTDLVTTPNEISGRVNLDFTLVPNDGSLHCYEGETPMMTSQAYLLALSNADVLTIEKLAAPCSGDDPGTWAFGASAISFVR